MRVVAGVIALVLSGGCWSSAAGILSPQLSPQAALDGLLASDRAFAAASRTTTVIPALTAMFAENVTMPGPGGLTSGRAAAADTLKANPANATGVLDWAPIRGGLSADGIHGFTYGYMTMMQPSGDMVPLKYLAYWVKQEGRWLVAAYKRRARPAGEVDAALRAPALPAQLQERLTSAAVMDAHRTSLIAAEQAFSDEAQRIGLGAAFTEYGLPDAMNMGGPDDRGFMFGNDNIGRNIGASEPTISSSVYWSTDSAIVASSGDLGVTFGFIRLHPKEGQAARPPVPFFTIWRKVNGVWRYIAE